MTPAKLLCKLRDFGEATVGATGVIVPARVPHLPRRREQAIFPLEPRSARRPRDASGRGLLRPRNHAESRDFGEW